jgi:hypothetical protein
LAGIGKMAQGKEVEAMHAILPGRRGRRLALTLALAVATAIGLIGVSAGSASAATCPSGAAAITPISYTLTGTAGIRTVTRLRGNVNQDDVVTGSFMVNPGCTGGVTVLLVSYEAPGPTWDPSTASRQQIFDQQTTTAFPGQNSIGPVVVPPGCFQIDLVRGAIILQFNPPSGTYSAQNRLVDADNGDPGCPALV